MEEKLKHLPLVTDLGHEAQAEALAELNHGGEFEQVELMGARGREDASYPFHYENDGADDQIETLQDIGEGGKVGEVRTEDLVGDGEEVLARGRHHRNIHELHHHPPCCLVSLH